MWSYCMDVQYCIYVQCFQDGVVMVAVMVCVCRCGTLSDTLDTLDTLPCLMTLYTNATTHTLKINNKILVNSVDTMNPWDYSRHIHKRNRGNIHATLSIRPNHSRRLNHPCIPYGCFHVLRYLYSHVGNRRLHW